MNTTPESATNSITGVWNKFEIYSGAILLISIFIIMCINMYIRISASGHLYERENAPQAEVAMILGASVYNNGNLSRALEDRALGAISLYENKVVEKILVSADSVQTGRKEVNAVVSYLEKYGIPESDIITDEGGIDTYHSMYRARHVYGVSSALIVTQKFHVARSIYIARSIGIDAHGIPTDSTYSDFKNSFREFFAAVKAFYEVNRQVVPQYATLKA